MNDAGGVRLAEAAGHLLDDADGFLERDRSARHLLRQRLAVVAGHGHVHLAVAVGFAEIEDGTDVGVIEQRRRARLALESQLRFRIARQLGRQELQRHHPAQLHILGAIDHAHATAAEVAGDAVMPDGRPDHVRLMMTAVVSSNCG